MKIFKILLLLIVGIKVWNRKYLTDKQRSFNTLCILAATNKWDEFKLHIEGALNNNCNLYELKELYKLPYTGYQLATNV